MCGICGELNFQARPNLTNLSPMLTTLQRRGPDHGGSYSDDYIALGHRRLSIIDLSDMASQPMIDSELGLVLVFNGTIYNYPELRQQLQAKGYRFFTQGDSEVILKAYHAWQQDCVKYLHGIFAFAIWDKCQQSLFLARDRLGIKPLYYSLDQQRLLFASNTQALLATKHVNTDIDPVALHHHLTLHAVIPAPRTILQGIRKLPPAHTLLITAKGKTQQQCYWQLSACRPPQTMTAQDWIIQTQLRLQQAVDKRRMIADVPVGVLLSGGLDSSLLVALLAKTGTEKLLTFSIGFDDTGHEKGNEFEYSDQVVARYATEHHKLYIPNPQVLARLPEAINAMAEPMVAQDAVAFYLLSEQVSQLVKVVQSGQGADEVFGGYFWYPKMQQSRGHYLQRFSQHYFDRDHSEYLATVHANYHGDDYTSLLVEQQLNQANADEFLDQVLRFDVTTLITDDPVKRVDNMTMAWGLEARVPFLDHHLVELAMQMPPELKLQRSGKAILKAIADPLLPNTVIDRPKGYFPMPALKYVRGEFLNWMRSILTSTSCQQRQLFQPDYINKLLAQPDAYFTRIQGNKLWHLALLEAWLQQHDIR